jgi:hypothetical protein
MRQSVIYPKLYLQGMEAKYEHVIPLKEHDGPCPHTRLAVFVTALSPHLRNLWGCLGHKVLNQFVKSSLILKV